MSGHLGSRHKLLAAWPKLINSSSDILRKRARNCSSSSLDSIAIDMQVAPAEVGRVLYTLARIATVSYRVRRYRLNSCGPVSGSWVKSSVLLSASGRRNHSKVGGGMRAIVKYLVLFLLFVLLPVANAQTVKGDINFASADGCCGDNGKAASYGYGKSYWLILQKQNSSN